MALLAEFGQPLMSTTLIPAGDELPLNDAELIRLRMQGELDLIIDAGACAAQPTTVIDLSGEVPVLVRRGAGTVDSLGLDFG
jgi:tRNA A37 threonylcarbamoyladenosine synthetase subunit TsaC/SUA5/YrdC